MVQPNANGLLPRNKLLKATYLLYESVVQNPMLE